MQARVVKISRSTNKIVSKLHFGCVLTECLVLPHLRPTSPSGKRSHFSLGDTDCLPTCHSLPLSSLIDMGLVHIGDSGQGEPHPFLRAPS